MTGVNDLQRRGSTAGDQDQVQAQRHKRLMISSGHVRNLLASAKSNQVGRRSRDLKLIDAVNTVAVNEPASIDAA